MSARSIRRDRRRQIERESKQQGRRSRRVTAGAGAALGATVLFAPAAEAATFTVDSLADDGSDGTLREEIQDANTSDGDDVITFAAGLTGTITLTSGTDSDIEVIYDGLEIQGPGPGQITVNGAGTDRIFTLYNFTAPDESVSVSGLTLTEGSTTGGYFGGAVYSGPAGSGDAAELTIANSVLTANSTAGGGGAVFTAYGSLTVLDSVFTANSADRFGGALYTGETDGDQATEVVIRNSLISDNQADLGSGGFATYDADGDVLIEGSTIAGNEAGSDGGGLGFATDEGAVTILDSTISGNEAGGSGGGVNLGYVNDAVLIQNSTVSGNSAEGYGGGIRSTYNRYDADRTVANSTIVANTADEGGGVFTYRYDNPLYGDGDDFTLSSTIVAGNGPVSEGPDLGEYDGSTGSFIVGFSLIGDTTDATIAEAPAGSNIFGLDPQLGGLANNGGPTQTHAPALSSPVLDKGVGSGLATDQRGATRTSDLGLVANATGGDGTDIGSVEIQAADVEAQCQGATARKLNGTQGDDVLIGTDAPEALFGLAGNDTANGAGGNDCVSGDDGNDKGTGGAGKDLVTGGAGKDKLAGNGGKDKLKGDAGKDKLKGGGGKDKLSGGGGKDKFNCGGGEDKVTADPKDKVSASCEKVVGTG